MAGTSPAMMSGKVFVQIGGKRFRALKFSPACFAKLLIEMRDQPLALQQVSAPP
jgi:hypothetical protein